MMKNFVISVLVIVFNLFSSTAENKAVIKFTQDKYDFGTIKESEGAVTCTFDFTNTGNAPLIIIQATASCGCTKPDYPEQPIAPKGKGKITVTYDPKNRPGSFKKNIVVYSNAKNDRSLLQITGVVLPKE